MPAERSAKSTIYPIPPMKPVMPPDRKAARLVWLVSCGWSAYPQLGQVWALSDTGLPHSGQVVMAIAVFLSHCKEWQLQSTSAKSESVEQQFDGVYLACRWVWLRRVRNVLGFI